MTATIRGLRINVTVGLSIKADSITENTKNFRDDRDYHKKCIDENSGRGISIGAEAGFDMQMDSYEGELELQELSELLKSTLNDNIREQVKEQLDEQLHHNRKDG